MDRIAQIKEELYEMDNRESMAELLSNMPDHVRFLLDEVERLNEVLNKCKKVLKWQKENHYLFKHHAYCTGKSTSSYFDWNKPEDFNCQCKLLNWMFWSKETIDELESV